MGSEDNPASAESTRRRLESTSLITHPVRDEELHDFHQHRLLPGSPKLDITYSLYASVVSHTLMRWDLVLDMKWLSWYSAIPASWEVDITYRTPKTPMANGSTTTIPPAR